MLTPEEQNELHRLLQAHIPIRAMARRLNRDVKTIRRALGRTPNRPAPAPSKLAPYHALITERVQQGLRAPRILRELRERGYPGGADDPESAAPDPAPAPAADAPAACTASRPCRRRKRSRTGAPTACTIARRETIVHAFSLILCYCRRLFVAFFRDERLPTLLWAHQEAFRYHQGLCRRIAYDNQTAITLGRVGGKPRWHPTFLDFAQHYGFEPSVGRPGHKERRGKVERPFHYLEHDFLAGRAFASWDDLNSQCRQWLDTVANVRVHGTTRRRVDEAFAEEQPCLIALPALALSGRARGNPHRPEGRLHPRRRLLLPRARRPRGRGPGDACASIPAHVQILDAAGTVVAAHRVPETPTRLPAPAPPPGQHRPARSRPVQEAAFLARFPDAHAFLEGLAPPHDHPHPHSPARPRPPRGPLRGARPCTHALAHATAYRNFNARAVERILQRAHPTVVPEPALGTLSPRPEAFGALDDIDSGSPARLHPGRHAPHRRPRS